MINRISRPNTLTNQACVSRYQEQRTNELRVDALLGSITLPSQTVIVRHDCVHIHVATSDDMSLWHTSFGGTLHPSPEHHGMEHWTLEIGISELNVPVLVHVLVPAGQLAMDTLMQAVSR